ncbi:MAG TPA: hypothetical protein PL038_01240 [Bacteroidales bacterium]|nr:hypothetical protein [Bacteroidales bacterium]
MVAKSENIGINDSLPILKVENNELLNIIDSFLEHEKLMEYYDSNLVFYIDILNRNGFTLVSFNSNDKFIKIGNEIGCFMFKDHFFIVSSNIETNLFERTKDKIKFDFYQPQEEIYDSSGYVIIDIYEDDRYTQWNYLLLNGNFIKIQ